MVGILVSFWDGLFSGAMLVSGRVTICPSNGVKLLLPNNQWNTNGSTTQKATNIAMEYPHFQYRNTSSIRVHFPASYISFPECNRIDSFDGLSLGFLVTFSTVIKRSPCFLHVTLFAGIIIPNAAEGTSKCTFMQYFDGRKLFFCARPQAKQSNKLDPRHSIGLVYLPTITS